jgi:transcription antitermination factor NusG
MGLRMAEPCLAGCSPEGTRRAEDERHWLAAYTKSQHEIGVARQLEAKEVAVLLPTFVKSSRWSDRTKRIAAPLFPSYVFVNVSLQERARVLQTAGVVSIVSASGKPVPLREEDVALLRECVARPQAFEPHAFLQIGQRVRVKQGPFTGWEGILTSKKNSARLIVSLENMMRSVAVDLAGADVETLN